MLTRHILLPNCLPLLSLAIHCLVSYREGDRGSHLTIVGLGADVLLTSTKGSAGWYMNSAALLADAGHSLNVKHRLPTSCLPFSGAALLYVPLGIVSPLSYAPRAQSHYG